MKKTAQYILLLLFLPIVLIQAQKDNEAKMTLLLRIPYVSMVDFAGSDKKVAYISGRGAQQIITPSTLNKTWLNYSSIIEGNSLNVISVNISSSNLPAGVAVKLAIGPAAEDGIGKLGKPVGSIYLSPYPQDVIVEIGSCYTGKGVQKGHQLTYTWEWKLSNEDLPEDYENFEIAVTYTITTNK